VDSTNKPARIAGLLYLFITVTGLFNLIYVPGKLFVRGDAAATASNILAHQSLWRINIAIGVVSNLGFVFLALALYHLLKDVSKWQARIMLVLVLVQVPQAFLDEVNQLAALVLARGADFLSVFDKPQRDALAMLFLKLNDQGTILSQAFWGIWLFPLGLLVFRSGFLPRFLGVWLIANGVAYLANSFAGLLLPQYLGIVSKITMPILLGEVAFMLWLVIMGAKPGLASGTGPTPAGGPSRGDV